jgi:hypothetical protein
MSVNYQAILSTNACILPYPSGDFKTSIYQVTVLHYLAPDPVTNFQRQNEELQPWLVVITLAWEPPAGKSPETHVDHYSLSVLPRPISHPQVNNVTMLSFQVTVDYNVNYRIAINSVNCAGSSLTSFITDVTFYGERFA